jgi:hypothetical protein
MIRVLNELLVLSCSAALIIGIVVALAGVL